MPLHPVHSKPSQQKDNEDSLCGSVFASRYMSKPIPTYRMPEEAMPPEVAYQLIHEELALDGNPQLNLASFVTVWMEPQADRLMTENIGKNFIDLEEYPCTAELQKRCVNMIAHLFHVPTEQGQSDSVGTATVGSSEAIMLAGLAFKWRWKQARKQAGLSTEKPNLVMGSNVQVCWEKFCRYFEVEARYVPVSENLLIMEPEKAMSYVDENTIGVCSILGSTYNGAFEDVKKLNDCLCKLNEEKGWNVPIHVDAASGGFIAPFLYPDLVWDFRLPLVRSINVSGHKYGLVYPGVGWVVWKSQEDLPQDLIFHVNYLGADQATFTLNFSKGAGQIVAQYYQFIPMGQNGYRAVLSNLQKICQYLRKKVEESGRFRVYSDEVSVPLVAFGLKEPQAYDEFDISHRLKEYGWIVPAYNFPPKAEHIKVLRVVIRETFSRDLCDMLWRDLMWTLEELDRKTPDSIRHGRELLMEKNRQKHKAFAHVKSQKQKTNGVC
ncbi:glutamate decarboxylase isoform 2 [Galdieria sulphuraria]|uniref:Glutamate decarboxylase n=1 Tax=Galdieria sulphuraria TaxID=130081 RepID=M2X3V7_GALSU|nr:glutamate decarboxylase isoform 2 [Galdieria sulphuraria]EME31110.1 glutamate decarboxylase isoform 2 [Galdieria sulphuraria]|eukprot:XP_005707630.1 glutamate decarboxylase isoform 2 [Galdieria sulphuraria]